MQNPEWGGPKLRRLNMGQVFIVLALVSAVITFFIFKGLLTGQAPQKVAEVKTKPLIVATHQLYAGELVTADSIKAIDWPDNHYPESGVYQTPEKLIGRVVKSDIYAGEPVYQFALAGEEAAGGLPVVIPKGFRAMTILVTENKGVGGFVKPGDRVDIVGSFEYRLPEATQKALSTKPGMLLQDSIHVAQTILQDVQVLAIAQEMYEKKNAFEQGIKSGKDAPAPASATPAPPAAPASPSPTGDTTKGKIVSSVTVAVTPEQAEKLAYADSRGELRLTLRPDNEHEQLHLIGATGDDIIPLQNLFEKFTKINSGLDPGMLASMQPDSDKKDSAPVPVIPVGRSIQIIEGTATNSVSF